MLNRVLKVVAIGYVACLAFASVHAEIPKLVNAGDPISAACMKPMKGDFAKPDHAGLQAEEVGIRNAAGHQLRAWFFRAENATQSILFCMGNSGNISLTLPYAKILQEAGYEVLLFDFQGFGESQGAPGISSLLTDSLAAFDYLQTRTQRPGKDIGVFGVSLGSILALTVAAEKNAGAVAVEDAFIPDETLDRFSRRLTADSPFAKMTLQGMKSLLLGRVDPLRNITRLRCPVFLIHVENDRLLPPSGSLRIAAKATTPARVWLMPVTGHAPESLETNDQEYAAQLASFFHEAFNSTLEQPSVQLVVEKQNAKAVAVKATINMDDAQTRHPIMLVLVDESGRCQFLPTWVQNQATVSTVMRSDPVHAFAIRYHFVTPLETRWKPELSEYSQALADYHQHASKVLNGRRAADYLTRSNGYGFGGNHRNIPQFPTAAANNLLNDRPKIAMAHGRIQARYARLLARLHCWPEHRLGKSPPANLSVFAEAMLEFLPKQPDEYYEWQNAGLQLSFRDTVVGDSLFRLAKERLQNNQPEQARDLLRTHVSILPPSVSTNLTEERIQAINTVADLTQP